MQRIFGGGIIIKKGRYIIFLSKLAGEPYVRLQLKEVDECDSMQKVRKS